MDKYGEEYAVFKGKIPVNRMTELLGKWGKKYNNALVAPESNDIGLAVTSGLQNEGYKNLIIQSK